MGLRWGWALLAFVVGAAMAVITVVLLVGGGPRGVGAKAGHRAGPAVEVPDATYAAEVLGVRRTGERTVLIEVKLPAGGQDCARNPRIEYLQDSEPDRPDTIYANVVYSATRNVPAGGCRDTTTAEVPMEVKAPLGDRVLMFNALNPAWAPAGEEYRRCDQTLGCFPPADHCNPAWVDKFMLTLDIPTNRIHGFREVRACDGNWLVLDVEPVSGACPPAQTGAPPCTGPTTTRRYLTFTPDGWNPVTATKEAGCAPIQAVRPDFPPALCQNLPPIR